MTGVASCGPVGVARNAGVAGIRTRLRVAARRTRKENVICRINVTVEALSVLMRNHKPNMVENGACPGRGVVAGLARSRKSCPNVIRICGRQVKGFVATVAIGGRGFEVAGQMAAGARHGDVEAGQGECGLVVIKRGWYPGGGRMAELARLRETRGDVIGTGRGVEVVQVARDAGCGQSNKHVVHVAGRAGDVDVEAGQRKWRLRVIEDAPRPGSGRVAERTVCGESCRDMARICGGCESRLVATVAIGRHRREVAPNVTQVAGHSDVETRQREYRLAVVEG